MIFFHFFGNASSDDICAADGTQCHRCVSPIEMGTDDGGFTVAVALYNATASCVSMAGRVIALARSPIRFPPFRRRMDDRPYINL